jgi:hypothetical protein
VRRLLVLTVLAVSSLGLVGAATAEHTDLDRPACANIQDVDFFYTFSSTVNLNLRTVAPSCRGVTYTLHVIVDEGEVVTTSVRGNGTSLVQITSSTFTDDDGVVCVFATTSRGGPEGMNQQLDRDPDSGCISLVPGGSGGTVAHG